MLKIHLRIKGLKKKLGSKFELFEKIGCICFIIFM